MAAAPPPQQHGHPHTSVGLGYFHLRLVGPAPALLLLRSDRLYSLSPSRRRGHRLRLLLDRPRRPHARGLLLSTSDCALRLTHRFYGDGAPSVNGRPLRARTPAELAVGDEVSVLWCGARYGLVVERFVLCGGGGCGAAGGAGSFGEGLVVRAESLRKRLRAISESEDPLSFLRDSSCLGNGGADAGVKELRQGGAGDLCPGNSAHPASDQNLPQDDCNLDQGKLEHHPDVAKGVGADTELCQESKGCGDDNEDQTGCSNGNGKQHHTEGCHSDGSTFFLNRLVGIGSLSDMRVEPHTGVTLPQLLHPVESLVRVFIATFTSDISWFLDYCKIPQHLPVTVACHNKERCWSASSENRMAAPFESHPNLLLVYPRFPEEIAFGKDRKKQGVACHHPKLIVLQREDSMRVVVTSANLVPRQEKHILHTKSAHRMFVGSVQTSVVGISHRFNMPSDAGSQLRALSAFLGKCRVNMHGTTEVILKRSTNIPADSNAVSVLVADLDKFSEEVNHDQCPQAGSVQLGFLPREVAKWVAPLCDSGFFNFSGFIYPREALEAAFGVTNTKVQLLLYVSKGPEFSRISELMFAILRVSYFRSNYLIGASSIGTSINPQFIASFASAAGKRPDQDFDSQESDPEWGCWTAKHELKKPSISLLFPTIDRVKKGVCGIHLCRNLLSLPEKTWQRLRPTGIFHDAIPQPYARIGHPMHVKSNDVVDLSDDTDEDVPDEDDEQEVELSDCSQQEKEEEKIYAETLWGQVDSSQSQGKD
nr:unnamed protein product [Digitaria exilis]